MQPQDVSAYELLEKRRVEDAGSMGYVMRHKKTGAKVVLLENDDENKVFYVAFRTPALDSTGAAHITEHSVLCGSERFPVKDPFIELAKGSLNTFLNAITYPEKTVYPVASCNDKDFQNLMEVYLDAVFHPNTYKEEKIFRQEGWHYELEKPEDDLTINGVVYSEMKGAFSDPDDVLERYVLNSLYPDTNYQYESGGDPEVIPELTYEKFLDFHRRYYHPSNSYIYLYGKMDMGEKLEYIDREYLSKYDELKIDSECSTQKPFESMHETVVEYPISDTESEKEKTYLSLTKSFGSNMDPELFIAIQVLDYCLCSAPGAPLRQALIDAGIGNEVYSTYEEGMRQAYFSVVAKGADPEQKEEFLKIYHDVLQGLVKNGLDKKALLAALNYYEFRFREADFGGSPKGLYLGLDLLDTWIFDETKPFLHLETFATFEVLRKKIDERYFENLISTYLLDNNFASFVMLVPKKGLQEQREKELAEKCKRYKESLSKEEIDALVRKTAELKAYQETEDTPEALACIPHLKREDLKKNAELPVNELREEGDLKVLYHQLPTNGIGYLRLQFNANDVAVEDLQYLGLLKGLLGLLNTDRYTYGELFNEIHLHSGGMSVNTGVMEGLKNTPGEYDVFVSIRIKALYAQLQKAAELLENMIMHTDFRQYKRIEEILAENYSGMQSDFLAAGHSAAARRAGSYLLSTSAAGELIGGLEQFRLVKNLLDHFEEKKELISEKLEGLCKLIFRPENLMIDYASEEKGYEAVKPVAGLFAEKLFKDPVKKTEKREFVVPVKANEAFTSASQVNYVAMAGDFRKKGLPYTGVLKAVKVFLSYDYLWNQVRVLGGAYGCFGDFGRLGTCFVVSYRDPHVKRTLDVYKSIAEYIESFEDSPENEEKLTQYIISAIGDLDTPKTPRLKADYSYSCYMFGMTDELIQQERDELLGATPAAVRKCADYVRAMVEADSICAFGNEEKLKEHRDLFGSVAPLFS